MYYCNNYIWYIWICIHICIYIYIYRRKPYVCTTKKYRGFIWKTSIAPTCSAHGLVRRKTMKICRGLIYKMKTRKSPNLEFYHVRVAERHASKQYPLHWDHTAGWLVIRLLVKHAYMKSLLRRCALPGEVKSWCIKVELELWHHRQLLVCCVRNDLNGGGLRPPPTPPLGNSNRNRQ